ncbi:hypothetical protein PAPYR_461 [Paratrimastix pyriformis]|uniref:Uncharacterized protein n=1 Tax=Paratrimastix pyriformis TaxID=342808 RepID=A0ABQ8V0L9_9EUKA|nr:hypothetical protein PAPYR_461 [Paratrimastix pyriformis]
MNAQGLDDGMHRVQEAELFPILRNVFRAFLLNYIFSNGRTPRFVLDNGETAPTSLEFSNKNAIDPVPLLATQDRKRCRHASWMPLEDYLALSFVAGLEPSQGSALGDTLCRMTRAVSPERTMHDFARNLWATAASLTAFHSDPTLVRPWLSAQPVSTALPPLHDPLLGAGRAYLLQLLWEDPCPGWLRFVGAWPSFPSCRPALVAAVSALCSRKPNEYASCSTTPSSARPDPGPRKAPFAALRQWVRLLAALPGASWEPARPTLGCATARSLSVAPAVTQSSARAALLKHRRMLFLARMRAVYGASLAPSLPVGPASATGRPVHPWIWAKQAAPQRRTASLMAIAPPDEAPLSWGGRGQVGASRDGPSAFGGWHPRWPPASPDRPAEAAARLRGLASCFVGLDESTSPSGAVFEVLFDPTGATERLFVIAGASPYEGLLFNYREGSHVALHDSSLTEHGLSRGIWAADGSALVGGTTEGAVLCWASDGTFRARFEEARTRPPSTYPTSHHITSHHITSLVGRHPPVAGGRLAQHLHEAAAPHFTDSQRQINKFSCSHDAPQLVASCTAQSVRLYHVGWCRHAGRLESPRLSPELAPINEGSAPKPLAHEPCCVPPGGPSASAVPPCGSVACGAEGVLRVLLWDVATRKLLGARMAHPQLTPWDLLADPTQNPYASFLTVAPSGRHILSAASDCRAVLLDAASLEICHTFALPPQRLDANCGCFSSCGRYLAVGGLDNSLTVFDLAAPHRPLHTFCHDAIPAGEESWGIFECKWLPGSCILASGSQDATVRLWDVSSPTEDALLNTLPTSNCVHGIGVHPSGALLAAGTDDQRLMLFGPAESPYRLTERTRVALPWPDPDDPSPDRPAPQAARGARAALRPSGWASTRGSPRAGLLRPTRGPSGRGPAFWCAPRPPPRGCR